MPQVVEPDRRYIQLSYTAAELITYSRRSQQFANFARYDEIVEYLCILADTN